MQLLTCLLLRQLGPRYKHFLILTKSPLDTLIWGGGGGGGRSWSVFMIKDTDCY